MTDGNDSSSVGFSESSQPSAIGSYLSANGHTSQPDGSATAKSTPAAIPDRTDGYATTDNGEAKKDISRQGLSLQGSADNYSGKTAKLSTPGGTESTELARRASLERNWLRQCAPIFLHPTHDIRAGHALVRVFFRFVQEGEEAEARSRGKEWTDYMAGGEDFVEWEDAAEACGKTGERGGENGVELAPELAGAVGEKGEAARGEAVNGSNADDLLCELVVVYEGEASYRRLNPYQVNHMATFFYMSFNKIV
ncbi:unnamed protein product, partial [Closterium sp. NIES-54]